jgi:hypothetical protein
LTPTQSDVNPPGTEEQSRVGTVQLALIASYPPLAPVRTYPDQLLEVKPGNDVAGSVVVVVEVVVPVPVDGSVVVVVEVVVLVPVDGNVVVVTEVVVVLGADLPTSTTFR